MTDAKNPEEVSLSAAAFLAVLVLFGFYLWTLSPGLSSYRDSADLAAAAHTLGVAHPPGYPGYVLLSKLLGGLLPFGDAAYKFNALSALYGAATAGLIGLFVFRLSGSWLGFTAAFLILGAAPAHTVLARVSEMYSLNALFAAGLLLSFPRGDSDVRRRACLAALLLGVGLANHQTLILMLPAILWVFIPIKDIRGGLRRLGPWPILFFILGVCLFAYLPVRSAAGPTVNWGDAHTWEGFRKIIFRSYYGGVRLHPEQAAGWSPSAWMGQAAFSGRLFWNQIGTVGVLLALWGLVGSPLGRRGALGVGFFFTGPFFVIWSNLDPAQATSFPILEPHLVLAVVFLAALAGLGAADIHSRLAGRPCAPNVEGSPPDGAEDCPPTVPSSGDVPLLELPERYGGRPRARPLGLLLLVLLLVQAGSKASGAFASRWNLTGHDLGKGLLSALPPGALLIDPDDQTAFALSYLQTVKGLRPDIIPILYFKSRWGYERLKSLHPELLPAREIRSGRELLREIVSRNMEAGRLLFVDLPQKTPEGTHAFPGTWAYSLGKAPVSRAEETAAFDRAWARSSLDRSRPNPTPDEFFSAHAASFRISALSNMGIAASRLGRTDKALRLYSQALRADETLSQAWNNRANILMNEGRYAASEGSYRAALSRDGSPRVRYNLSRVLLKKGDREGARRELRRAVAVGDLPEAANDLGLMELRSGDPRRAVDILMRLASRHPDYSLAYYNLGEAYARLKEYPKAREAFQAYLEREKNPQDRLAAQRKIEALDSLDGK